jgi:Ca-activated chloride channel homolog
MGLSDGVPIPVYQGDSQVGFKKDQDGNAVVTKLDEQGMRQIAEAGGGTYVRASNQQDELETIFKEVQTMEKKEFGAKIFTEYEDRFQYFLAVALILLCIEYFIGERKNKWLAKWSFFRER